MAKWYFQRDGATQGPVDAGQLKQLVALGQIRPDDLVRREDMQGWSKVSMVRGLGSSPSSVPSSSSASDTTKQELGRPNSQKMAGDNSSRHPLRRRVPTPVFLAIPCLVLSYVGYVLYTARQEGLQNIESIKEGNDRISRMDQDSLEQQLAQADSLGQADGPPSINQFEPIFEVAQHEETPDKWREIRLQRQGGIEIVNLRSIARQSKGYDFVCGIYLYGKGEVDILKRAMDRYISLVEIRKTDPLKAGKQKLGKTSLHELWYSIDGGDCILEFTDPKNTFRGKMTMIGTETVQSFRMLLEEYDTLHSVLDKLEHAAR